MNKIQLEVIDELTFFKHYALTKADIGKCFYWRTYYRKKDNSSKNYSVTETNSLINNLKIPNNISDSRRLYYKNQSINQATNELKIILDQQVQSPGFFEGTVFVPIPSSKTKQDPYYNDSNLQILQGLKKNYPTIDTREIIYQKISTLSDHTSEKRKSVKELIDNYAVDEGLLTFIPKRIILFDDVITAGRHFKALQTILSNRLPGIEILGFFIARTVNPLDPDLILP